MEWSEYETRCRSLKRTVTRLMKKSGSFFQVFFLTRFFEVEPTLQCKKYARLPSCFPGGGYSHTLPIRVCAAERGRDFRTGYPFQRRLLERGIIFRTHKSSSFVSSHLKLFKDRLLLKIRFNALTSKLLYSCCTLERSIKNWPISRTGYQF